MATSATSPEPPREHRWLDGSTTALLAGDARADTPGHAARRTRRDWVVDVTCFVLSVLFAVLGYVTQVSGETTFRPTVAGSDEALRVLNVAVGVAACLAIWLRRRHPVALAVAAAVATAVSAMAGVAGAIALFTVIVHRSSRTVALVVAANVAASLLYPLLYRDDALPYWGSASIGLAFLAVVIAWGLAVRSRRDLVRSLWTRAERAEAEQQLHVERARAQERARIAREMHDVLAHRISLLSLHAGALEFRPDAPPEDVERTAGVIRSSAHQALEDLREVIGILRDPGESADGSGAAEPPQPGPADLPTLVAEGREAGMRVSTAWDLEALRDVPTTTGRSAFRIVQEGLTNARKHAPGTLVRVGVRGRAGEGLRVEIENPMPAGSGIAGAGAATASAHAGGDPAVLSTLAARASEIPGGGTGLVGLAERATLGGGRLEHGVRDGVFRLEAWLPWPT